MSKLGIVPFSQSSSWIERQLCRKKECNTRKRQKKQRVKGVFLFEVSVNGSGNPSVKNKRLVDKSISYSTTPQSEKR
jgi:hypothetical protein